MMNKISRQDVIDLLQLNEILLQAATAQGLLVPLDDKGHWFDGSHPAFQDGGADLRSSLMLTRWQAGKLLDVAASTFDYHRKRLGVEIADTYEGKRGTGHLYRLVDVQMVGEKLQNHS